MIRSLGAPGSSPKRFPVIATGQTGTTQILVYNREVDEKTKKPMAGSKLFKVFRVTSEENLVDLMQQLKAKIGKVEGLEIRIIGDQVVVDGKVLIPRDLRRVMTILQITSEK